MTSIKTKTQHKSQAFTIASSQIRKEEKENSIKPSIKKNSPPLLDPISSSIFIISTYYNTRVPPIYPYVFAYVCIACESRSLSLSSRQIVNSKESKKKKKKKERKEKKKKPPINPWYQG